MNRIPTRVRTRSLRRWTAALLLALASTSVYAASDILVFGDSLSAGYGLQRHEGWVSLLRERLAHRAPGVAVDNASVSGETSAGGRARLQAALDRYQPDIVILELGANDGLRALSVDTMKTNLRAMIEASQQTGARVLLLGMRIPANYGKSYSNRFHGAFDTIAEQTGVAYVPFFLQPVAMDRDNFQDDGLHPNAGAQPALLDYLWPHIAALLKTARQTPAAS